MAGPRAYTALNGIGAEQLPSKYDASITYDPTQPNGSAMANRAVILTGNNIVGLCADGDHIDGKLIDVQADGFCTVQYDGIAGYPAGNGAVVTAGTKACGALGPAAAKGYVRNCANDAEISNAQARIWDPSDATQVMIDL